MNIFDAYGEISKVEQDPTIINGRYEFQKNAEKFIADDIFEKLLLKKSDTVLDIGCGSGEISFKIAQRVSSVTLCDHPNTIKRIQKIYGLEKFDYISSDFLKAEFSNIKFDKILAYSVIQCLSSENELFNFIDKILNLLNPAGRAMIGDIPNESKLNRFLSSKRGEILLREWDNKKKEKGLKYTKIEDYISKDCKFIKLNDLLIQKILMHVREKDFNAYIYEQKSELPFGNSREDILISAKEFYL